MLYNKDLCKRPATTKFPTSWDGLRTASQAIMTRPARPAGASRQAPAARRRSGSFSNFYWWSKGWAFIDQQPNDGNYFVNITPDADRGGVRLLQTLSRRRPQSEGEPVDLPVGRARDRRGHGHRQHRASPAFPIRWRSQIIDDVQAALSRASPSVRRRAASGRRQRLEDLLRRPHARHQRQHQQPRAAWKLIQFLATAGSDLHQALHQLRPAAAPAHEL